jgi:predicted metalloprotease with PDZ domain
VARLQSPIADLAKEFILVRLTNMRGVNLEVFDFDFDLTWSAFFLSPHEIVYGRYGGRDGLSADSRLSLAGLRYAMAQALATHRLRTEDRELKIESQKPKMERSQQTIDAYPAVQRRTTNSCIHCHQVYDVRRDSLQAQGKWRLDEVWVYPLPENIGLTLDVDQGNRVQAVVKDSPVDRAGPQVGDLLKSVNGVPTASIADVQFGLNRAPAEGEIPIAWLRHGKPMSGRINLAKDWRKTDISWRWSLRGLEPIPWVQGEDLSASEKHELGLNEKQLAFYQGAFLSNPARHAGIRVHDIVLGIDNQKLEMTARQFQAFMRLHYKVGDRVTYNILRDGQRLDVPLTLIARPSR